jgi:hypothetical protein
MHGERRTVLIALAANFVIAVRQQLDDGVDSSRVEQLSNELDRSLRDVERDVDQVFLDPTPRS